MGKRNVWYLVMFGLFGIASRSWCTCQVNFRNFGTAGIFDGREIAPY